MTQTRFHGAHPDAIWATARRLGRFTYAQLSAEAGVSMWTVQRIVRGWQDRSMVSAEGLLGKHRLFAVSATAPVQLPAEPVGNPRQNMWRAMQMMQAFSPADVAVHSTTDTVKVSIEDATAWCQTLARAGYLRVVRKAQPPIKAAVYRLIANTGPRPPMVRRISVVIDGNTGRVMHMAGGLKGGSHAAQG